MQLKARSIFLILGWVLAILCSSQDSALAKGLSVSTMTGESGTEYHLYQKNDLGIDWQTTRPPKDNTKLKLCIPAAFTTKTGTVVGIYCQNGEVKNRKQISKPIGGAIIITDGKFSIFPTNSGACFSDEFVKSLETKKATLFQQFQVVEKGTPARFKDHKSFQMRAVVKFKDGKEGIIESDTAITFKTFNTDLAALGVEDGLYTDMGAWDEGWYRDPKTSKLVTIGLVRTRTGKQTNWLTFYER
jgi:hypothetical protein